MWRFDFTGVKVTLVNCFVLQQNSMAETMAFFNVGLRCWNIQKFSWFVGISWNWNGGTFSEQKMANPGGLTSPV
jgi:hypothetical protein